MDTKIVGVNDAILKMYETTEETDLVGKHALSLLPPQEREKVYKAVVGLSETGYFTAESVVLTKKYNPCTVQFSCTLMKDSMGNPAGIFGVVKNLSEIKKKEEALKQADLEWQRTFDSLPDLIAILEKKHSIARVNQAMAKRLGISPEQCTGLTCYKCIHGANKPPDFCPNVKTLHDGKEHSAEVYEPRLGGFFLLTTTPLKDEKGNIAGSVHVARDITEYKRLEEALKLSQDRYRATVEGCSDGIWDRDLKTKKVFFSDQWKRILGYEPSEIKDEIAEFDRLIHPKDKDETWSKIQAHIRGETPFYMTVFRMKHKDGSWRWIQSRGSVIRDKDGTPCRIAGSHTDITERKRIEEELNRHTMEL
jgi:PAS domain S-box-containing protein